MSKRFGSVVALRSATMSVRAGEVHALMGANGAGKSTLVKILTGVFMADGGAIAVGGAARSFRSPKEARLSGIVSVYQDPALVPDLTVADNMRLADVGLKAVQAWLGDARRRRPRIQRLCARSSLSAPAPDRPRPRSGVRPDRPAARRDHRGSAGRSVAKRFPRRSPVARAWSFGDLHFAPHGRGRGALRSRHGAARRRRRRGDGHRARQRRADRLTDAGRGWGEAARSRNRRSGAKARAPRRTAPALEVRGPAMPARCSTTSRSACMPGEVLGVAALEGQGQEELFDCIAGVRRSDGGEILANGKTLQASPSRRRDRGRTRAGARQSPAGAAATTFDSRKRRAAGIPQSAQMGSDPACSTSASASHRR